MQTAGGGWTLGFIKNSRHTSPINGFGSGRRSLSHLAHNPTASSSSNESRMGWLDLNDLSYTELRLAAYQNGARTYLSPSRRVAHPLWSRRLPAVRQAGYYWCGGRAAFTDAGRGQVNRPAGAPADCKGHGSLGSGWDFGPAGTNGGLTLCGGDASNWMHVRYNGATLSFGNRGGAQAIWVR